MNTKGYTLGLLKDCIYKELDEFSLNGEETHFSDSLKSDLELRMLYAINSSATRVLTSIPTLNKSHFALLKESPVVLFKQNISASEFSYAPEQTYTRLAVHFYYTGLCEICFLAQDGKILYQDKINALGNQLCEYRRIIDVSEPVALITLKNENHGLSVSDLVIRNIQNSDITEELISPYGQVCVSLPQNVLTVTSVNVDGHLLCENDYYLQDSILFCNSKYQGKAQITYRPSAPVFTQDSDDDEPIGLSDTVCLAIIYLAASQLCPQENGPTYTRLIANYQNVIANHYNCENKTDRIINNFYRHTKRLLRRM